jgi:hypothetical protein
METKYSSLSDSEKKEVEKELKDDPQVLQAVKDDHYCAKCFMVYYNCLCSHED